VTYADGAAFAADDSTLSLYLSVLKRLAALAVQPDTNRASAINEKGAQDFELRNRLVWRIESSIAIRKLSVTWSSCRTRLIGLAALSAAVQSDVFHTSQSDFRQQAEIIVPALMQNLWIGNLDELKLQ
jgi:hypothetical protein